MEKRARKLGLFTVLAFLALGCHQAVAAGLTLDRTQSLEEILADCDPATGLPHGVTPPPAQTPRQRIIINPNWLRRPDARAFAAAYPAAARSARLSGQVVVQCLVGADGHTHDCAVAQEAPPAMGFGAAGLQLAQDMLFVPKRVDCGAVDGGRVSIPLTFKLP